MTFDEWLRLFPWLHQPNRQCIVSADLDGVACALLQSITLHWETVGTYDSKLLSLYVPVDRIDWDNVIFIDVEILRASIQSIGNHLFALDADDVEHLRSTLSNCANPNLWRGINVNDSFGSKYPFSTLPLLLASHALRDNAFRLSRFWMALVLHTDSSFTNAAHYQANALDWLSAMDTDGRSPGLDRMCRKLKRIPGQMMLALLNEVQTWAGKAGFGKKQRACRFDPRVASDNERITALLDRLMDELGEHVALPFGSDPVYTEEYTLETYRNDTKGRRTETFRMAREHRVLSMAATGKTETGLSITFPNPDSPVTVLR